ncbi:hypothetical protein [Bradyrhizobium zhanjiangense]|uniref:hypothetical protein n=1 Tax=Bradyrhizobium zhanjiangense TaxID=1325107 RepID=UPI0010086BC9|nr:hypothetical protein [Bradyrhizobium zhanjiangense]
MIVALARLVRSFFAAAFAASRMEVSINVPSGARARNAHRVLLCQFDRANGGSFLPLTMQVLAFDKLTSRRKCNEPMVDHHYTSSPADRI